MLLAQVRPGGRTCCCGARTVRLAMQGREHGGERRPRCATYPEDPDETDDQSDRRQRLQKVGSQEYAPAPDALAAHRLLVLKKHAAAILVVARLRNGTWTVPCTCVHACPSPSPVACRCAKERGMAPEYLVILCENYRQEIGQRQERHRVTWSNIDFNQCSRDPAAWRWTEGGGGSRSPASTRRHIGFRVGTSWRVIAVTALPARSLRENVAPATPRLMVGNAPCRSAARARPC